MNDRILVRRVAVYGYHGLLPEEERLGQRFFVSLDCGLDLTEVARTDDLAHGLSYADLVALAVRISTERRFRTIESLAGAIAAEALAAFPKLHRITVLVDKPDAPIPAVLDGVAVEITRFRDG